MVEAGAAKEAAETLDVARWMRETFRPDDELVLSAGREQYTRFCIFKYICPQLQTFRQKLLSKYG